MTKGKLYVRQRNSRSQKVVTVVKYAGKEVEVVTNEPPTDKFPMGVVSIAS